MKKLVCELWGFLKDKICAFIGLIFKLLHTKKNEPQNYCTPLMVSEYLDRMEKVHLEILEEKKPIDKTIILWWGIEGLRLNEDGSTEWISRKKSKSINTVNHDVFCQTQNAVVYNRINYSMGDCQCTQAEINWLQENINYLYL